MCGIFGYVGNKKASPIVAEGLKRLEYRGYDSAGFAVQNQDRIEVVKDQGRLEEVIPELKRKNLEGNLAISQSRWATHGAPSKKNAHPHWDCDRNIFVVHNGIIENYEEIKGKLKEKGHSFRSETDTEVIPHLIEEFEPETESLKEAVRVALKQMVGAYAVAVVSSSEPDKIVVARKGSPLLIGLGEKENFVASDAPALIQHTKQVIYLDEEEMGVITPTDFEVLTLDNDEVEKVPEKLDWDVKQARKQGYDHFMRKEIEEEPKAVENAIRGRLIEDQGKAKLGGLEQVEDELRDIERVVIVACGTSRYAGLVGEYMLEEYAGIPTEVEYGSEFRYRKPVLDDNTAVLAISQSGETADTLAAVKEANEKDALTLGIVNVVGSTIARETDAGVYNHAGPEIGVASTKAFISQLSVLSLLTVFLGRQRDMSLVMGRRILEELEEIPELLGKELKQESKIEELAERYKDYPNFLFLGRKYNFPTALEGALKLKEISYLHAEGYSAGEMKHGPISLIGEGFPTVALAPSDSVYDKVVSNLEEIKTRNGKLLVLATEGNDKIKNLTDDVIYIPKTLEMLTPIVAILPLHLLAYHAACRLGHDPDHPRHLAKSVTVE